MKTNRLMPFMETAVVYCEDHTKHTNTLCGQSAEFYYAKAGGIYRTAGARKVKNYPLSDYG
jgi:hypothetical protein